MNLARLSPLRPFAWMLVFLLLGRVIYGAPVGPDSPQGFSVILGVVLLFSWFAASAWLGGIAIFGLAEGYALPLLAGLSMLAHFGQWHGLVGGLGFFPSPWLLVPLFLAPLWFRFSACPRLRFPRFADFPLLPLALFLLLFLPMALRPDPMPDPLSYHLSSARWWVESGRVFLPPQNIQLFLAGTWDALNLWAMSLTGSSPDGGLLAGQIFGQLIHFFLGGALTWALLTAIIKHWYPHLRGSAWISAFALLSSSQLNTVFIAKNDWGVSALLLGCFLLLAKKPPKRSHVLWAGFFLGCALSTKISAAFVALPLLSLLLFQGAGLRGRHLLLFSLATLFGASAYLARNIYFTGNPIFPFASGIFSSAWIGPSWQRAVAYEGVGFGVAGKAFFAKEIARDSPFLWLAAGVFFYSLVVRRKMRPEFYALFTGALFFFLWAGSSAEWRLFGSGIFMLSSLAIAHALERLGSVRTERWWKPIPLSALFVAAALSVQFPWRTLLDWPNRRPLPLELRQHLGGQVLAFVRLNLPLEKKVASLNEPRLYYLSAYQAYRVWDRPALDRQLHTAKTYGDLIRSLRSAEIDYLILSRLNWDRLMNPVIVDMFDEMSLKYPSTVVFEGGSAKLIDTRELEKMMLGKKGE